MANKRILIVKLSSLGDLFHALPAVHNLKVGLQADIDWAVHSTYVELAGCFTDVARVVRVHRHGFFRNLGALRRALRAETYDLVVDLQGLLKSAVVARLARARRVVGPSFHREGAVLFYSAVAGPRNRDRHAVDENLDIVRYLKLDSVPPAFPVRFPQRSMTGARPRIALLPVSRWPSKNWPAEHFAAVARALKERLGASCFVLGGSADVAICGRIAQQAGGAVNLAGKTTLVDMGSYLAEMDLVIANDSGPMHMAAALGVPVLALFGPTDPRRTGPYGTQHRVLTTEAECRPCHREECPWQTGACLRDISPERVVQTALEMLERSG